MKAQPTNKEVTPASLKKDSFIKCFAFVASYLLLKSLIQMHKLDWTFSAEEVISKTWEGSLFIILLAPIIFFIMYKLNVNKLNKNK